MQAFKKALKNNKKPLFVFFYAPWYASLPANQHLSDVIAGVATARLFAAP